MFRQVLSRGLSVKHINADLSSVNDLDLLMFNSEKNIPTSIATTVSTRYSFNNIFVS